MYNKVTTVFWNDVLSVALFFEHTVNPTNQPQLRQGAGFYRHGSSAGMRIIIGGILM